LLRVSLSPCRRSHPAGVDRRVSQSATAHTAFAFTVAGSASGAPHLRGHLCVRLRYGLETRPHPMDEAVERLQKVGFPSPCSPSYRALTFPLVGFPPTEHTSLRWTHHRTGDFRLIRLSRKRDGTMTRQLPSLTGPQWIQGQGPRLIPLWLQGPSCLPFSLSWQSFTMSRALHHGIWLLRCLRHPSHTLAFSRPLTRQGGVGLPTFHGVQRIEFPVAACCRPGASGITHRHTTECRCQAPPLLGQVYQPLSPVAVHGPLAQVPLVSIGNRSGRSTCLWLRVAELLSLGFPPSRVPLVNAGQVDLTPLSMCSSLCEQSIRHVKWRGAASGGAFRDKNQDKT